MSVVPSDAESLRMKYQVLANLWLVAQLRQPGRALCADLTKDTWGDFWVELLSQDNFFTNREVDNEDWAAPQWAQCMEYEFQLKKDAVSNNLETRTPCGQRTEIKSIALGHPSVNC